MYGMKGNVCTAREFAVSLVSNRLKRAHLTPGNLNNEQFALAS
jgi:hypothetical protein